MFERFTSSARRVVTLAQEQARLRGHTAIGSEHLLLGLVGHEPGVAAQVLAQLGVGGEAAGHEVAALAPPGRGVLAGHIPFTAAAKAALELAVAEAQELDGYHVASEHLLLGLLREGAGGGRRALANLGVGYQQVREALAARGDGGGNGAVPERLGLQREDRGAADRWGAGPTGASPQLLRVVPVARSFRPAGARLLTLAALEVWSHGLELRYALTPGLPPERHHATAVRWEAQDDVGTPYQPHGNRGSGDQAVWVGGARFTPAPPATASTLTFAFHGPDPAEAQRVEVHLDAGVSLAKA